MQCSYESVYNQELKYNCHSKQINQEKELNNPLQLEWKMLMDTFTLKSSPINNEWQYYLYILKFI